MYRRIPDEKDETNFMDDAMCMTRRSFLALGHSSAVLLAAACVPKGIGRKGDTVLTFGIITDLHYADRDPYGTRHYRDSLAKLEAGVAVMNEARPNFLIQLGDLIDKADKETETECLRAIDSVFRKFRGERRRTLGNHDMATFSKREFLKLSGARENYYAFDSGGCRFIVLDGNYNRDGSEYCAGNFDWRESYIHRGQRDWLAAELKCVRDRRVVVFVHQNLHDETNDHGVKNSPEVRRILEDAGNVVAVFQGHDHAGGFHMVNGISYITLRAAVEGPGLENNAFALVAVERERIEVRGYGKQRSHVVKI